MNDLSLDEEFKRLQAARGGADAMLASIDTERRMLVERSHRLDQLERLTLGLKPEIWESAVAE
jgi:hypothetical protein